MRTHVNDWMSIPMQRRRMRAEIRARDERWKAKTHAVVTHPAHGSITVPCASPLAATECAAERWGVNTWEITGEATVMRAPPEQEERYGAGQ